MDNYPTIGQSLGRVLIVDDDPLIALSARSILESCGYICSNAECIDSAWESVQDQSYHLTICDHDLPDGKGTVLLEFMLQAKLLVPVIYVSAASPGILAIVGTYPNVCEIVPTISSPTARPH